MYSMQRGASRGRMTAPPCHSYDAFGVFGTALFEEIDVYYASARNAVQISPTAPQDCPEWPAALAKCDRTKATPECPHPPRAVKWPLRSPQYIGFVWRFGMGAQGA